MHLKCCCEKTETKIGKAECIINCYCYSFQIQAFIYVSFFLFSGGCNYVVSHFKLFY